MFTLTWSLDLHSHRSLAFEANINPLKIIVYIPWNVSAELIVHANAEWMYPETIHVQV